MLPGCQIGDASVASVGLFLGQETGQNQHRQLHDRVLVFVAETGHIGAEGMFMRVNEIIAFNVGNHNGLIHGVPS